MRPGNADGSGDSLKNEKVHEFIARAHQPGHGDTLCGIEAWISRESPTEVETVLGDRLDIVGGDNSKVTCKECNENRIRA